MATYDGPELVLALAEVELPTLGHYLEDVFCEPAIRAIGDVRRMAGPAVTVHLTEPDAIAVNHALLRAQPGSVVVIRVESGRHAPVGAVTTAVAKARGVVGIVVDGPVTDVDVLSAQAGELPVFARGTTALTTKRLGTAVAHVGDPVIIGGVEINEGDIVAGDANGVISLAPHSVPTQVFDDARASDQAEPALLDRIAAGHPLEDLIALKTPPK